jgi:hypothetical protein
MTPLPMDDAELAAYLHLTPADATIVIPKLSPGRRSLYDRMNKTVTGAHATSDLSHVTCHNNSMAAEPLIETAGSAPILEG